MSECVFVGLAALGPFVFIDLSNRDIGLNELVGRYHVVLLCPRETLAGRKTTATVPANFGGSTSTLMPATWIGTVYHHFG